MANWEYKLISSGPLGFANMKLLEEHLNQMGNEEWEIVSFTTKPDNPLVFHGLARRPIARDWFPPAEAKPAYAPPPITKEPEDDGRDERSFAEDLPVQRPANAPETPELKLGNFDDLEGSEEDLPTLFDALQPFLRKNPRGDHSVGLDFLAKKFEQDERELLAAFVECGLEVPERAGEKGAVVDHDGGLYWLDRDNKGRVGINTRQKKFKTVQGTPVAAEPAAERPAAPPATPTEHRWERDEPAKKQSRGEHQTRAERQLRAPQSERAPQQERTPQPERAESTLPPDRDSFLGRIHSMMRRNRRGQGWSGSFPYLTKALKLNEAELIEKLNGLGLQLRDERDKPVFAEDGDFLFWLNKNHRSEIWINAKLAREGGNHGDDRRDERRDEHRNESGDHREAAPTAASVEPTPVAPAPITLPPENILSAIRLLLQPKKRGEGVTAQVAEVAEKLEKSTAQMMAALSSAGLNVPDSPKSKPTFAEQGGEIFWLNVNPKGQVWINAKASKAAARSRSKKKD